MAPAKIVLERTVPPGGEGAFGAWLEGLLASARETGALEGSSVLAHDSERFVLLRFRTEAELDEWRNHADFALHPHAISTGLETWFTLPGHPLPRVPPPRWKMALLTWLALMPTAFTLSHVVAYVLPHALVLPVSTALTVSALTWLLMPNITRLVQRWLYPRR